MPRIEKQPYRESYLAPLPAEGTPISPGGSPIGQGSTEFATRPAPVGNHTNIPYPQHKRTNAAHVPRSSTDYRFHEAVMLRSPLPAVARRPSGEQIAECAPRRLMTTHLTPFVAVVPPRVSLPSQSEPRLALPTGARHTSESSLMITQRQLLQPLGPPIPRSRTMSALTPLAAFVANPRQTTQSKQQIREAQPTAYWSGRFTALNDRFCNEDMTLTTSKRMSEDRRTRRIFIHLESLCVTREAKESLNHFQSIYLLHHKHLRLSSRKDDGGEEKDQRMSILKRIIGHVKKRSGAATSESLD
ncbi:MAG: hypothetical protein M1839_007584 [Geoglossum umbratile]|nr:MAG: hypothetical protein M1839_007584 [Geoglossum umbratile]